MKLNKRLIWIGIMAVLAGLAGCNLPMNAPAGATPSPFAFPTQNLTLTALFEPPVIIPPTVTPSSAAPAATATAAQPTPMVATATQAPPTATATATATAAEPTATQTAGATATKTSAQTYMRTSPTAVAPYVSTAPKIDGDWGEWGDNSKQYPITSVVYGGKNWSNADDLEAAYRVAWDNTNLYLAVKVHDDVYVQEATGKEMYKGDSAEILIDTNVAADYYTQVLSPDDYQLGLSPGNPVGTNTESYLWYPTSKTGKATGVSVAAVSADGIWRLEAAIPWSLLGVTPANGMHLGIAVSISDNDAAGQKVEQTMISSAPNRNSPFDPTEWGDLTLQK